MESLETQQSVINLGKRLINNFKDDEVDEITAWMCNYIAEKILLAEQTDNEDTKQECFDTILKLWERHSEPPRDCRRLNFLREYDNENTKLYP